MKTTSSPPASGGGGGTARFGGMGGMLALAVLWLHGWQVILLVLSAVLVGCLINNTGSRVCHSRSTRKLKAGAGRPAPWT